ncbi:putative tetratricopeptide-like helical domain superfamily [Helianthus annuus]|nr:putative tetratricopeptide-like helical domain superfamily [Helianthus annuus]
MGKSIPSSAKLQDFARIITSDRTQQSKRIPKSLSNKTRVVPPPEPAKPKGVRIVHSEKQQQRLKIMDESSSMNRRIPLAEVVLECSRRWFQDTLKEAKAGDTSMQVLVGQMYCSGYGVVKDAQKGQAWISRASRSRSSVWKVGDKHPGYNASDSDSDEVKVEDKQS